MKKIKLLHTALLFISVMIILLGCKNDINDISDNQNKLITNQKYILNIINKSHQSGSLAIYQIFPEHEKLNNLYSLVWMFHSFHLNESVSFKWETIYSLMWLETPSLIPGDVIVNPPSFQINETDPTNPKNNTLILSHDINGYTFKQVVDNKQIGFITIKADHTIPNNQAAVGIAMNSKPVIAVNAYANMTYQFTPSSTYWIIFGDFKEGEILDLTSIHNPTKDFFSKPIEIIFPTNVNELSIIFKEDNTFEITP